jgi:hypothetical protein
VKKDTRYKRMNPGLPVEKRESYAIRTELTPYVARNYETK